VNFQGEKVGKVQKPLGPDYLKGSFRRVGRGGGKHGVKPRKKKRTTAPGTCLKSWNNAQNDTKKRRNTVSQEQGKDLDEMKSTPPLQLENAIAPPRKNLKTAMQGGKTVPTKRRCRARDWKAKV